MWMPRQMLMSVVSAAGDEPCPQHTRRCGGGQCVSETKWCDFERDCPDGSDEMSCRPESVYMKREIEISGHLRWPNSMNSHAHSRTHVEREMTRH